MTETSERYERLADAFAAKIAAVPSGRWSRIDPDDLAYLRATAASFGDAMRSPQASGPEVEPPPGADEQQCFLAFLGRR